MALKTVRKSADDEPFAALGFKIMTDPYVGKLTFFRVYSGVLKSGSYVAELRRRANVNVSVVFSKCMQTAVKKSAKFTPVISQLLLVLKDTTTGDTLCDEKNPVILESMNFPDPVISVAIEPKTKADQDKMGIAFPKLV